MFQVHEQRMLKVVDINPAAYNPRRISPEKYEGLKESIRTEGFVEPLVVQKKGLGLIGGHQRLRAVKELAIEAGEKPPDLPCTIIDIDDVRAKKLNIKLNSLTGEFDARLLGELLIDIYDDPVKVIHEEALHLGFEQEEVIKYMHLVEPPPPKPAGDDGGTSFAKNTTLSLEFDSASIRDAVKKILKERSELEKKKSGDVIASLLMPMRTRGVKKKASKKRRAA